MVKGKTVGKMESMVNDSFYFMEKIVNEILHKHKALLIK